MRPGSIVAAALLVVTMAGCIHYARPDSRRASGGTCERACDHYVECRQPSDSPPLLRGCLDECQEVFVTDGQADEDSLLEFVALDCHATIAFVEGASGRAPGESALPRDSGAAHADVSE